MEQHEIPKYRVKLVREPDSLYGSFVQITKAEAAVEMFKTLIQDSPDEQFWSLYFDTAGHPIGAIMISQGTLNRCLAGPREIIRNALLLNANSIILVHNHPSGKVTPSNADRAVTRAMVAAAKLMDITVNDHIIIGYNNFYSFSQEQESSLIP